MIPEAALQERGREAAEARRLRGQIEMVELGEARRQRKLRRIEVVEARRQRMRMQAEARDSRGGGRRG